MTQFAYKEIRWVCTCGLPRLFVRTGVTSNGELCAKWNCRNCGKDVMALMKLDAIIDSIPSMPGKPLRPPLQLPAPQCTDADLKLLGEAHIKWD